MDMVKITFWTGIILIGLSYWVLDYQSQLDRTGWLLLLVGFLVALGQAVIKNTEQRKVK